MHVCHVHSTPSSTFSKPLKHNLLIASHHHQLRMMEAPFTQLSSTFEDVSLPHAPSTSALVRVCTAMMTTHEYEVLAFFLQSAQFTSTQQHDLYHALMPQWEARFVDHCFPCSDRQRHGATTLYNVLRTFHTNCSSSSATTASSHNTRANGATTTVSKKTTRQWLMSSARKRQRVHSVQQGFSKL